MCPSFSLLRVNVQLLPGVPCEASLINVYKPLRDPCKKEGIVIGTAVVGD